MAVLVYGHSEALAAWAAERIPHMRGGDFGPCQAIGIAAGLDPKDRLYGVVVFHDYQAGCGTIQVSAAATSPKWANIPLLKGILRYPFVQLNCFKMWVAIPHRNERAIRINKGLGLRQDGILRHHFGKGSHAVIMSLLKPEWLAGRWYSEVPQKKEAA